MRFGYVTPNSWGVVDPHQTVQLAVRAEQLAMDSVWVSHHVLHEGFIKERLGTAPYHDPLVMLTAFATATTTIRLGTSVMVLPYLHPMVTAKTVATIDHLSGGRVDLGIGVGGLQSEHDKLGVVPFAHRGRYADEFLEVLATTWTPGPSSYKGQFFAFDDLEAYPVPLQDGGVPLLVGGNGAAALRRTLRFGAGWQGIGLTPEQVGPRRARVTDALIAAGRGADPFRYQVRLQPSLEEITAPDWPERVAAYESAGIGELLLGPLSGDVELHRRWLDSLAEARRDR